MSSVLSLLPVNQFEESHSFVNDRSLMRRVTFESGHYFESNMRCRVGQGGQPWDAWWLSFLQGGVAQSLGSRPKDVSVLDLFSSVGGLSLGVREAARSMNMRFSSMLAADLDSESLNTYKANFVPCVTANRSVRELVDFQVLGRGRDAQLADLPNAVDEARDFRGIDLIVGGPPCQGHSSLNNHTRGDDLRNDLYLTVPALAIALDAKAIVIENVPRVVKDKQQVVATTVKILEDAGYFVTTGVLAADQMGWAQTRQRHFVVASRMAQPPELRDVAEDMRRPARSVWWAIQDLEGSLSADNVFDSVPKMSVENIQRINYLFDHDSYELPNHVRPDCHKDGHTYPSVYGRLFRDLPSPTITTGFQTPGRGRYIHPTQRRVLTPHEAARIQGFPDSFRFESSYGKVSKGQLQKWIGDAVPSILGYVAGLAALGTLK